MTTYNMDFMRQAPEIYFNTRVEEYPCGLIKTTVASKPIFKLPGWEPAGYDMPFQSKQQNPDNSSRLDSVKRAKDKIYKIALLNDFQYFITWTLDGKLIDRFDPVVVSKKLKVFLSNKVQRNGMSYIVVPEYHADGKGIHMHGLISGDFKLLDSHRKASDGKVVYNMPNWTYGFSTCIETSGDKTHIARYITKYISKEFRKIFGKFYYAGGNIVREPKTTLYNTDYFSYDLPEYSIREANIGFKYFDRMEVK